jgi:hypothetical protein
VVVRQSTLGLTPYAVMLGALAVQDEITIRFSFAALADPRHEPANGPN